MCSTCRLRVPSATSARPVFTRNLPHTELADGDFTEEPGRAVTREYQCDEGDAFLTTAEYNVFLVSSSNSSAATDVIAVDGIGPSTRPGYEFSGACVLKLLISNLGTLGLQQDVHLVFPLFIRGRSVLLDFLWPCV